MANIIKNREVPLKDVVWAYCNLLVCKKDAIFLKGFNKFGSIVTKNLIDYGNRLELKFDLQIYPDVQNNVALMDMDLDTSNNTFMSLTFFESQLVMTIKENDTLKYFGSNTYRDDLEWINMVVSVDGQNVKVDANGFNEFNYTFTLPLEYCTLSFGNNFVPIGEEAKDENAFKIKNVCLTTMHGEFPLVPDDLIQIVDK